MLWKTNFLSFSVHLSEIANFLIKREVICEFPPKCCKTTKKHSLAVCGSLWGEKPVYVNISLIFLIWSKTFAKQIQIFHRIFPFSNMLRKTNYLRLSVLFSEIVTFWTKKRTSLWISPKMLQNNRITEFICMWLTLRRKTSFFKYILHFTGLIKKSFKTNPNFPQDFPLFKHVKKNKLSEYFCALFWDSHFLD